MLIHVIVCVGLNLEILAVITKIDDNEARKGLIKTNLCVHRGGTDVRKTEFPRSKNVGLVWNIGFIFSFRAAGAAGAAHKWHVHAFVKTKTFAYFFRMYG